MPTIRLQSSDGEIFETYEENVKCSGIIKTMLENCDMTVGETIVLPLDVNSVILRKFLQWTNYHKDDPVPFEDNVNDTYRPKKINLSSWDVDFLKLDESILCGLMSAAQYLDVSALMDATGQALAHILRVTSYAHMQ